MKDSVFEGVLSELPVNSQNVVIKVDYSYKDIDGTHKGSTERYFASKAEATFRRETSKMEVAARSFARDLAEVLSSVKAFEDRFDKRLRKLENKDGRSEQ